MLGIVQIPHPNNETGKSLYFEVTDTVDGSIYAGVEPETYDTANKADYANAMQELGTASRRYAGEFPAIVNPGIYEIAVYEMAGAEPAEGDTLLAYGDWYWSGSELSPPITAAEPQPAVLDFGERDVYAGVTEDLPFSVQLFASDGVSASAWTTSDVVHFVLSTREGGEPIALLLDVRSDQYTANNSRVIITSLGDAVTGAQATGYIRLAQGDTDALVDAWDDAVLSKRLVGEMYYTDDSETNPADAKKLVLRGIVHLHRSGAQT